MMETISQSELSPNLISAVMYYDSLMLYDKEKVLCGGEKDKTIWLQIRQL